jgi:hypothetical protein
MCFFRTNYILLDNVEAIKEYGFLIYFLLPQELSEMEVISQHCI